MTSPWAGPPWNPRDWDPRWRGSSSCRRWPASSRRGRPCRPQIRRRWPHRTRRTTTPSSSAHYGGTSRRFMATSWFLRGERTPFMGMQGVELRRRCHLGSALPSLAGGAGSWSSSLLQASALPPAARRLLSGAVWLLDDTSGNRSMDMPWWLVAASSSKFQPSAPSPSPSPSRLPKMRLKRPGGCNIYV